MLENTGLGITIGGAIGALISFFVFAGWLIVGMLRLGRMRRPAMVLSIALGAALIGSAILRLAGAPEDAFLALAGVCTFAATGTLVPEAIRAYSERKLEKAGRVDSLSENRPHARGLGPFAWEPNLSTRMASAKTPAAEHERWVSPDGALELELVLGVSGERELFVRLLAPGQSGVRFVRIAIQEGGSERELLLLASPSLDYTTRVRLGNRRGPLAIRWRPPILALADIDSTDERAIAEALRGAPEAEIEQWIGLAKPPWLANLLDRLLEGGTD